MAMETKETTQLLIRLQAGDASATEKLLPLVYEQLRALAAEFLRSERRNHTLQPTALVHEAYLRLIDQTQVQWNDRAHFFAVAARAMRRILVDHGVARRAQKRGGGNPVLRLESDTAPATMREVDPVVLDDALKTLAELDERKAQVVELRFFGGLSVEETSEALSISVSTVEADWRMAKAWLSRELSSR